jgi:hypothetical protein
MSGTKQTLSDSLSGTNENTIFRLAGLDCTLGNGKNFVEMFE